MSRWNNISSKIGATLRISDESILHALPFAAWLSFLALISIYTSHSADRKVHEIEKLSESRQELEAEYTETKEKLTELSLESKVLRKAEELGLTAPTERADKIVVEE
ncbi:FtsL-like putative cell division protein [Schleiferiaceae bacterium]|nr:FtsL-like putative cell division protein [Schleiferiaceae bacterium]